MLLALASAKGAPGTTTAALALTLSWPRPVLLADLDSRGGDVMLTYGQGQDTQGRGLLGLQVASRRESWSTALWSQVVDLGDEGNVGPQRWLLPGLNRPQQAGSMDWVGLAQMLGSLPVDVIADCGSVRAVHTPAPVWAAADAVALLLRPTLAGVHAALEAGALLRAELRATGLGVDRLGSVVVGPGRPYPRRDVETALAQTAPVLGELPWDPTASAALGDGQAPTRRVRSSPLMRGGAVLAHALQAHAAAVTAVPADAVDRDGLVQEGPRRGV